MNKKTLAAVVAAILILICAISAYVLVRCTDAEDVSKDVFSENSESSDVDESTASEPSDASEVEESLVDISDTSKDPAPETSTPAEESDVSEPETSEVETSTAPDVSDPPSDESSEPSETSKVEEPSQPDEPSEPAHTHTWTKATCTSPKTCKACGETEGTTTAHAWKSATCLAPQTCNVCGTTVGDVGNHRYEDNTCTVCGDKREAICGDTPVEIVVNGKEHTVESYEGAKELLTLEDLENMAEGETITIEYNGAIITYVVNEDGTFTNSKSGRTFSAENVYNRYISQWCPYCGKRAGHGDNGTCVRYLIDTDCTYCGEFCKALECHTCNDDND